MTERKSPAEKIDTICLKGMVIYPHLQGIFGERYCSSNRIVVLKDTPSEIKVAVPEQSLPCIDEIRKVLPRQKRLDFQLGDQLEIEQVFIRGYDPFDLSHSR
ncbi:MAG TPA: hypothetical protein VFG28_00415 [Syntrophales bacterium]|nr:hypothetical protein [Syntrophales bacterium]